MSWGAHLFSTQETKVGGGLCELKASLVSVASSRAAWSTESIPEQPGPHSEKTVSKHKPSHQACVG